MAKNYVNINLFKDLPGMDEELLRRLTRLLLDLDVTIKNITEPAGITDTVYVTDVSGKTGVLEITNGQATSLRRRT